MQLYDLRGEITRAASVGFDSQEYLQTTKSVFGETFQRTAGDILQIETLQQHVEGAEQPHSTYVSVDGHPNGYGKQVIWDPKDNALAAVVFLYAGDPLGVMVSGVAAGDSVEIVSATGLSSFSEAKTETNLLATSIIGVVGVGARIAASYFGQPGLLPIIELGEDYANKKFGETHIQAKVRDPFGYDMQKGYRARQEGGVIVSMPEAGRAFYSGKSESRWIKRPGDPRLPEYHPDHVHNAFFLKGIGRSQERHTASSGGDLIILPWDYKFEDNRGYYRLHVLLTRGG